jgi:hypothetical protein
MKGILDPLDKLTTIDPKQDGDKYLKKCEECAQAYSEMKVVRHHYKENVPILFGMIGLVKTSTTQDLNRNCSIVAATTMGLQFSGDWTNRVLKDPNEQDWTTKFKAEIKEYDEGHGTNHRDEFDKMQQYVKDSVRGGGAEYSVRLKEMRENYNSSSPQ